MLIAGGGVAAVECLLALRDLAGERVELSLLSASREFFDRPLTVGEAFGRSSARAIPLAQIAGESAFLWDQLASVDANKRVAVTRQGRRVPYDALVVAAGAIPRAVVPGAVTFAGRPDDVAALGRVLDEVVSGAASSLAFAAPSERMWTLPLYELALMSADYLRACGSKAELWVVTPEEQPLALFGPAAASTLERMLGERGIRLRTSCRPAALDGRALRFAGSGMLYVDRVVTLPRLEGPRIGGLPHDAEGFIPVDAHGRVSGVRGVYAAGDVTAFPLKQGGLASQQADAVAETIAAGLGVAVTPRPFRPVLRGLLFTGGAPVYLRAEPQREPREATVAIEAHRLRAGINRDSFAASQALWWPPAKVAARYLGPFLATARPQPLSAELLSDRVPVPSPASAVDDEYEDALELALLLADTDARWGDYGSALSALDAAQALRGALPPEYERKRETWRTAARLT